MTARWSSSGGFSGDVGLRLFAKANKQFFAKVAELKVSQSPDATALDPK